MQIKAQMRQTANIFLTGKNNLCSEKTVHECRALAFVARGQPGINNKSMRP